jgi:hypothetical protein
MPSMKPYGAKPAKGGKAMPAVKMPAKGKPMKKGK